MSIACGHARIRDEIGGSAPSWSTRVIALFRFAFLVWFLGLLVLSMLALANLLFGEGDFADRSNDFIPRLVVSVLWPLAIMTPRGRYQLWTRWQGKR